MNVGRDFANFDRGHIDKFFEMLATGSGIHAEQAAIAIRRGERVDGIGETSVLADLLK